MKSNVITFVTFGVMSIIICSTFLYTTGFSFIKNFLENIFNNRRSYDDQKTRKIIKWYKYSDIVIDTMFIYGILISGSLVLLITNELKMLIVSPLIYKLPLALYPLYMLIVLCRVIKKRKKIVINEKKEILSCIVLLWGFLLSVYLVIRGIFTDCLLNLSGLFVVGSFNWMLSWVVIGIIWLPFTNLYDLMKMKKSK